MTDELRAKTLALIAWDAWRMNCLRHVAVLNLPQGAIAAGFVRNAIWDAVFGLSTPLADVDVVYFDPVCLTREYEAGYAAQLRLRLDVPWQVRNQARMHVHNKVPAYTSAADAVARFPETATCLSVCWHPVQGLSMPNTEGLADAWRGVLRPNACVSNAAHLLRERVRMKPWLGHWPGLQVV